MIRQDENGIKTAYAYDGLGRVTGYTLNHGGTSPSPISIWIGYDASSNVTSMTDGKGNTSTWSYDRQSRLVGEALCGGDTKSFTYNDLGLPSTTTDSKSASATYHYDQHGLLTQKLVSFLPGPLQTTFERFEYDGAYRLKSAQDDDTQAQFDYATPHGDLLWEKLKIGDREIQTTSYAWDDTGRRLDQVTYPLGRGTWDYDYDELDRVKEIQRTGVTKVRYWYEGPGDRLVRREKGADVTQPAKIVSSYAYDPLKRVMEVKHVRAQAGTTIRELDYGWGNGTSGRIFERAWEISYDGASYLSKSYEYDKAYRLTRASGSTGTWTYAYDAAQSRTSYTGPSGYASYGINSENQVVSETAYPSGSAGYGYDGAGNRITKTIQGGGQSYVYDYRNQLVSVTDLSLSPAVSWSFRYDALGRRVGEERVQGASTTTRLFYYAGQDIIVETDGTHNVQTESVFGVGVDNVEWTGNGSMERFALEDSLGSVVAVVDTSGTVKTSFSYTPYGETTQGGSESYPYAFTGRRYNGELKLYDYRSRFYDPRLGRFLQRDTIGIWGDGVGLGNGYTYVGNNPVNRVDPWGMSITEVTRNPAALEVEARTLRGPGVTPFWPSEPGKEPVTVPYVRPPDDDGDGNEEEEEGECEPAHVVPDPVGQTILELPIVILTGGWNLLRGFLAKAGTKAAANLGDDAVRAVGGKLDDLLESGAKAADNAPKGAGNTNPFKGPVEKPVNVVDPKGNTIRVNPGEQVTGSPDRKWIQVRDSSGKPTGARLDGPHKPASHPDPRAQQPHGHVPGVTNPDGTPWLPVNE